MPAYRFRLATLLKLREANRDERRGELAAAQRADDMLLERLTTFNAELAALRGNYAQAALPGVIKVDQLIDVQRYEVVVATERKTVEGQRAMLAVEIEKRRQALVAADGEVRVLEKLRQKQRERHQFELARAEIKVLDEVAARSYAKGGD